MIWAPSLIATSLFNIQSWQYENSSFTTMNSILIALKSRLTLYRINMILQSNLATSLISMVLFFCMTYGKRKKERKRKIRLQRSAFIRSFVRSFVFPPPTFTRFNVHGVPLLQPNEKTDFGRNKAGPSTCLPGG